MIVAWGVSCTAKIRAGETALCVNRDPLQATRRFTKMWPEPQQVVGPVVPLTGAHLQCNRITPVKFNEPGLAGWNGGGKNKSVF